MAKQIKHPATEEHGQIDVFEDSGVVVEPPTEEQLEVTRSIETVNKANEASVLMSLLCGTLGLVPYKTTHVELVKEFTDLQNRSLECQKFLQEKFIAAPVPEKRRKNAKMKYQ